MTFLFFLLFGFRIQCILSNNSLDTYCFGLRPICKLKTNPNISYITLLSNLSHIYLSRKGRPTLYTAAVVHLKIVSVFLKTALKNDLVASWWHFLASKIRFNLKYSRPTTIRLLLLHRLYRMTRKWDTTL